MRAHLIRLGVLSLTAAITTMGACNKNKEQSKTPGLVEGVSDDVGTEVDAAGETVEGVGEDVGEELENAEETVEGVGEDVGETAEDVID